MNIEENKNEKEIKDDGKLIRISKEADDAILAVLKRVSESVSNFRITKSSLASYVIERFCPRIGDEDMKALYMQSVSEIDLLRQAYKQAMESGVIPENLRDILLSNAGLTGSAKKAKKPRQKDGSNATNEDTEAA